MEVRPQLEIRHRARPSIPHGYIKSLNATRPQEQYFNVPLLSQGHPQGPCQPVREPQIAAFLRLRLSFILQHALLLFHIVIYLNPERGCGIAVSVVTAGVSVHHPTEQRPLVPAERLFLSVQEFLCEDFTDRV